jgi:hypothetical protein
MAAAGVSHTDPAERAMAFAGLDTLAILALIVLVANARDEHS